MKASRAVNGYRKRHRMAGHSAAAEAFLSFVQSTIPLIFFDHRQVFNNPSSFTMDLNGDTFVRSSDSLTINIKMSNNKGPYAAEKAQVRIPGVPKLMWAAKMTSYTTSNSKATDDGEGTKDGKTATGPYEITSAQVPVPTSPYHLLIRVAVASHCHTDSVVRAGVFGTSLPYIGSHEGSGTVVYAGPSAETKPYNFQKGDRVMCGLPLGLCGTCPDCTPAGLFDRNLRIVREQYCANKKGHVGVHLNGCFAEFVLVDARSTTHVPNSVSLVDAAPLACAGRTAWRAVAAACAGVSRFERGVDDAVWLAIVGAGGGLGHLAIQFAKAQGAKVIAIDARDAALGFSKKMGADVVLDARMGKEKLVEEVKKAMAESGIDGDGAYATINLTDADDAAALACAVTRMHGTMVQIAQPDQVKIPFQEIVFRDIKMKGSMLCSSDESREMMKFIGRRAYDKDSKIRPTTMGFWGLHSVNKMVEAVERGDVEGKAVLIIDKAQTDKDKDVLGVW